MFSRPWAIEPAHGSAFVAALHDAASARLAGIKPEAREKKAQVQDVGGVRSLTMAGPMLHRPPAWLADFGVEYTDTLKLTGDIIAADADPSVKSILIRADTPGGMVGGVPELADVIAGCKKPVHVAVDGMLASAGVWASASADSINATRSSEIGSIGVYTVRVDTSKAMEDCGIKVHLISSGGVKGAGADGRVTPELLAEDARIIGQLRDQFVAAVSAGRGRDLSPRATGQIWLAHDAERIGLVDQVGQQASPTPPPEGQDDSMDLSPLAALAAKHPTKAAEILKLAAEGKTDAEIGASLADAARAEEVAAARKDAADAKASADKLAADLKSALEQVEKLKTDLAAAEERAGKIAGMAVSAPTDPGPDSKGDKPLSRAAFQAMTPRDRAAWIQANGVDALSTLTP